MGEVGGTKSLVIEDKVRTPEERWREYCVGVLESPITRMRLMELIAGGKDSNSQWVKARDSLKAIELHLIWGLEKPTTKSVTTNVDVQLKGYSTEELATRAQELLKDLKLINRVVEAKEIKEGGNGEEEG